MKKIQIHQATTVLAALLANGYSRTKVKQLLKYRALRVGEQLPAHPEHPLAAGDVLVVTSEKEGGVRYPPCPGITIVYEDKEILVVDKPPGLLTIASASEKTKTMFYKLTACLGERPDGKERVFIVHRLDQGASGLLVFAKTEQAKHALQQSWPQAQKRFRAIVEGTPCPPSGTIKSLLCESKIHRVYSDKTGSGAGKPAETRYQVIHTAGDYALVELIPVTARKNQLRVHLAEQGHPVAGDKKYGAKTDPIKRLALQASFLSFAHPISGAPMEFSLELPAKFKTLLKETQVQ
ncbi:pseudouridine synthase, RluA family [Desulfobulbus propionicus DSM 2032]|jgi:23S rRNA pseudouridine1911/1915/1917 synthase|uniref:Pseudouridine synthase, RluA family n=1 Tax=Desulfobulbus propionicus (strain ATCC 33891 / DSM 2032 / VKM B-1956 / 1pr3) TaxID=577650 RepID=A0A7U4DNR3_DESPD|nr:RluA family pseudouridine synthase [Desulfobulbus propionicus]ADW17274.1 pseudouridine synthase, RluA family [Desulfobulbus propionicus DSM 2032]